MQEEKQEKNNIKAERINREKEGEYRTPPPLSSLLNRHLVAISASHRKGRPCLAGAPGSGSSSLPLLQKQQSASALHCIALQCSAVQPILAKAERPAAAAAQDQALTAPARPAKRSTEQPHIPAVCACQEALGTERKRERTESCSHWRLPNGVALRSTPVFLIPFCFLFTLLNNDDNVIDCCCAISQPACHCIHIYSPTTLALKQFPLLCKNSGNAHYHKFGPTSVCPFFSLFKMTHTPI